MRFEDAGCDNPCGAEPMGCTQCDIITGRINQSRVGADDWMDREWEEDEMEE